MRSLFSTLVVIVTLVSGCATDPVETDTAAGDDVISTSIEAAPDVQTTSDTSVSPCTPAQTSRSTTTIQTTVSTTAPTSTSTQTTATSRTTSEPTTTSSAPTTAETSSTTPSDPGLAAQQQRLTDLGYWLGTVDGRFGSLTAHAATAFQKAEGLPRTGQLDAATTDRLATATTPGARSDAGTILEIDLAHQILLVAVDGRVARIYDIATGKPATPTPPGRFAIYTQIDGYRHAPLGTLYRPKYFNGGIALHGYTSVPAQPASHGCVRLTYPAMDDLWASGAAPIGTPVWVY